MGSYYTPEYGDNIYDLGGAVMSCLRQAKCSAGTIGAVLERIMGAPDYDAAVRVCAEYITIKGIPSSTSQTGGQKP